MYLYYTGEFSDFIIRANDFAWIPLDQNNRDYNIFLNYLDENNLTLNDLSPYSL